MNKIIILFCLCLSLATPLSGQHNLSFRFSQHFSRFVFKDSEGNKAEDFKFQPSFGYALDYHYITKNGLFIRSNFGYKKYTAKASQNSMNLDWDLHYLGLGAGGGYMFSETRYRPYAGVTINYDYLIRGAQTIGPVYYDLVEEKALKRADLSITPFAGMQYLFTDKAAAFLEFSYTRGLLNLEQDPGQELHNSAISFHFGLAFSISAKKQDVYF